MDDEKNIASKEYIPVPYEATSFAELFSIKEEREKSRDALDLAEQYHQLSHNIISQSSVDEIEEKVIKLLE